MRDISSTIENLINPTFLTHPQVWNNESYKKMVISIMTSMGTNMLLDNNNTGARTGNRAASTLAKAILVLENYDSRNSIGVAYNNRVVTTKVRDLHSGLSSVRRDILKFYSKRASCSCLKIIHQEARRTIPKLGRCWHCRKEKERIALSVCSRCMIILLLEGVSSCQLA